MRATHNQVLYREVNEKLVDLNAAFAELLELACTWICECANPGCTKPIEMTLDEYERLRAHPNRFAVLPGHADTASERVVEAHEHYLVVAKIGAPNRTPLGTADV
jgi:hypothetical protein